MAGVGTFSAFFASAIAFGAYSGIPALRVYAFLFGLGGGGACGVFAALAAHLTRGPAAYEPIDGDAGAWGMLEFDERTRLP